MPTAFSCKVTGADTLARAFADIGDSVAQRQVMLDALKKAAAPLVAEARALAPRGDGSGDDRPLATTIVAKASLSKSQFAKRGGRRDQAELFVGPTAPHAHLVEFGHWLVKVKRDRSRSVLNRRGRSVSPIISRTVVGRVRAQPFMRPAFDATKDVMQRNLEAEFFGALERAAKRWRIQFERGRPSGVARRVVAAQIARSES